MSHLRIALPLLVAPLLLLVLLPRAASAGDGCPSCATAAAKPVEGSATAPADAAPAPNPDPAAAGEPATLEVAGKVAETLDGGGYTYVRIETADGASVWAAGPPAKLAVGSEIAVRAGMKMKDFHSKALSRDFPELLFADSLGGEPAATTGMPHGHPPVAAGAGMPHGHPPVAAASEEKIEGIARADRTVAELYSAKDELSGQIVQVRGKVVKVNRGILGRNWVHLQDGSGEAGTNDLTVTTQGEAAKGDTVLAAGVVSVDRDFGSGYRYAVLLEEASLTVEPKAAGEAEKKEEPAKEKPASE